MSTPRLVDRVRSAKFVSVTRLERHRLKFHKSSNDGSGKCDIELTNDQTDVVYGVVFQILASDKEELDRKEGLGYGYMEKSVSVIDQNNESIDAVTYYATKIDASLKPYDRYKEHVVRGAKEHNLPAVYIKIIEAVESLPDPNPTRHKKESIYCQLGQ
jgi:gamma-glutamylcyclotransferase